MEKLNKTNCQDSSFMQLMTFPESKSTITYMPTEKKSIMQKKNQKPKNKNKLRTLFFNLFRQLSCSPGKANKSSSP